MPPEVWPCLRFLAPAPPGVCQRLVWSPPRCLLSSSAAVWFQVTFAHKTAICFSLKQAIYNRYFKKKCSLRYNFRTSKLSSVQCRILWFWWTEGALNKEEHVCHQCRRSPVHSILLTMAFCNSENPGQLLLLKVSPLFWLLNNSHLPRHLIVFTLNFSDQIFIS